MATSFAYTLTSTKSTRSVPLPQPRNKQIHSVVANMTGSGLYQRPTMCKYCNRVFDVPTLTIDISEKDVPVRTRTCGDCLWEMGQNEDLRERRARADEESRRSIVSLSDQSTSTTSGHKLSQSSLIGIDLIHSDMESTDRSIESPEQTHLSLGSQSRRAKSEGRISSDVTERDIRQQSNVRRLLN